MAGSDEAAGCNAQGRFGGGVDGHRQREPDAGELRQLHTASNVVPRVNLDKLFIRGP